jgi:hypothetical protein
MPLSTTFSSGSLPPPLPILTSHIFHHSTHPPFLSGSSSSSWTPCSFIYPNQPNLPTSTLLLVTGFDFSDRAT